MRHNIRLYLCACRFSHDLSHLLWRLYVKLMDYLTFLIKSNHSRVCDGVRNRVGQIVIAEAC